MMYRKRTAKEGSEQGFSLIELLAVLAIIGVLTTIVIGSLSASRGKARDVRRLADMKVIQLGLALYYDVNKVYPTAANLGVLVTQKYLPSIPTDPAGPVYGSYEYLTYNSNRNYCIGVKLEGTVPNDSTTNSNCNGLTNSNYKATR